MAWAAAKISNASLHIMGSRTFHGIACWWPTSTDVFAAPMNDLPPPLQCRGIEAYEQTWDVLFRYHKPGKTVNFRDLAVIAGADVAFAVAIMWCEPDSSSNPTD